MALFLVRFEMPAPPPAVTLRAASTSEGMPGQRFEAGLLVEAATAVRALHVVARLLYGADGFQSWIAEGRETPFTEVLEVDSPELERHCVWPPHGRD